MRVSLKRDSLEAILAPDVGGAVAAFRVDGRPVFHPDALRAWGAPGLGEFPMGPYVNRIAGGRFRWRNEAIALPRNAPDHPHPLHGVGWQAAWACTVMDQNAARMTMHSPACAAWPWAVTMTRTFILHPDALQIDFALTNDDARPMPAAIGLHPYFPAAGAVLRLHAQALWETTPDGIPTHSSHPPVLDKLRGGSAVETLSLDHCLAGWDGAAEIEWPDLRLRIETVPSQRFVQVYAPPGADFFCVEPQTSAPDAVNRGDAFELAAGETLAFTTRFAVLARRRT
ncbi:MAG: aldose 1-epimerase [Hyphomonadaceae bacterium]|nr:aldose 1-epimerase [Hyphomonadaceae bacterium]